MMTRYELIEVAKELGVYYRQSNIEELEEDIREYIYKYIKNKHKAADKLSNVLKKYLYEECECVFQDIEGNLMDYNGKVVGKRKGFKEK